MLASNWEPLPAVVAMNIVVLAAILQYFVWRVPNALTLPAILAGWIFAGYADAVRPAPSHALVTSLLVSGLALLLMVNFYRTGSLGAGCVKAQMAFAAWMGAAMPLQAAAVLVAVVTVVGLAITYLMARMEVVGVPHEERCDYLFPAQVTISLTAVAGTLAGWLLLQPV
jgi:Flp pilus assembly protein protease CpaA